MSDIHTFEDRMRDAEEKMSRIREAQMALQSIAETLSARPSAALVVGERQAAAQERLADVALRSAEALEAVVTDVVMSRAPVVSTEVANHAAQAATAVVLELCRHWVEGGSLIELPAKCSAAEEFGRSWSRFYAAAIAPPTPRENTDER